MRTMKRSGGPSFQTSRCRRASLRAEITYCWRALPSGLRLRAQFACLLASLKLEDGQLALKAMGPGGINSVVKLANGEIALGGATLNGDIGTAWIAVLNDATEIIAEPPLDGSYNQFMALAPFPSGELVAVQSPWRHRLQLSNPTSLSVARQFLQVGDFGKSQSQRTATCHWMPASATSDIREQ